jgi:hypothetical protein
MNEQQEHLTSVLNNQKTLATEIQELNNAIAIKKEQFFKLQGIVEYLTSLGVNPIETSTPENENGIEQ